MYELIEYTQCTFLKQNIHMGGVRYHADCILGDAIMDMYTDSSSSSSSSGYGTMLMRHNTKKA